MKRKGKKYTAGKLSSFINCTGKHKFFAICSKEKDVLNFLKRNEFEAWMIVLTSLLVVTGILIFIDNISWIATYLLFYCVSHRIKELLNKQNNEIADQVALFISENRKPGGIAGGYHEKE